MSIGKASRYRAYVAKSIRLLTTSGFSAANLIAAGPPFVKANRETPGADKEATTAARSAVTAFSEKSVAGRCERPVPRRSYRTSVRFLANASKKGVRVECKWSSEKESTNCAKQPAPDPRPGDSRRCAYRRRKCNSGPRVQARQ